jgi:hypothetical protein
MIYDLDGDIVLGRGDRAEIRLEDPFASSRHARVHEQGNIVVIEDLGSTNGTYLNEELLQTPGRCTRATACASATANSRSRWTEMLRVAEQYAGTDTGRQRRANEDSLLARSPLFVVADGMGGAQAGEVASRIAVESFRHGLDDASRTRARLAALALARELAHPRAVPLERRAGRHGHDAHAVYVGERGGGDRACGRQPRLLPARRRAAAPDRRPFARR